MDLFKPGDRVRVSDPHLDVLRAIMPDSPPNNVGTVDHITGDAVIINFDDGGAAPYFMCEVDHLDNEASV